MTDLAPLIRRALFAQAERDALYVTDVELGELRRLFPPPPEPPWEPVDRPAARTLQASFYGVPLIVDPILAWDQDRRARGVVTEVVTPDALFRPEAAERLRVRLALERAQREGYR